MNRIWFAKGLKGMIARRIQADLLRQGFVVGTPDKFVDGDFGRNTESAVKLLQEDRALPATGAIDAATWSQLTPDPLPSLFERCLGLTAAFEGHGFGLVQGNFDGAGLTWGVIGFTLANRQIQAITADAEAASPGLLERCMKTLASDWQRICATPLAQQLVWANSISSGHDLTAVRADWLRAFACLGDDPIVKHIQMQRAYDKYFVPAAASARKLRLKTEIGVALAFDVHVQNGGFKSDAYAMSAHLSASTPELQRRLALADAVADSALPRWQTDVRERKLGIARGKGLVHGASYMLAAWGLDEIKAA